MQTLLFFQAFFSFPGSEEHPPETAALNPFAGGADPLTVVLLFVLLCILVWWLLRTQTDQVEPVAGGDHGHDHGHHEEGHAPAHHAAAEMAAPAPVEISAPLTPDDLKVLEGIGPKVAEVLNAAGITTFAQLADAAPDQLQAVLNEAGYKYMNPTTWPAQARLAAAGDWDGLKKMQDELTAGRS